MEVDMEEYMNLKLKKLRKYISVIDRISICFRETQQYENYQFIREVPESYNDYYVYGIGMIDSEFPLEDDYFRDGKHEPIKDSIGSMGKDFTYKKCIEIVLSKIPRDQYTMDDMIELE
jgi:hypothetical protein